jgi:hypothetical protein
MTEDSPLAWLDDSEKETERGFRLSYGPLVKLLERQIHLIGNCVAEILKHRPSVKITINELKKSSDGGLLRSLVPLFLLVQALDNLQASRLNMLHGYLSVSQSCMRNVVESLRWANAAQHSAQHALSWLNNKDYPKERGFSLDPPVGEIWKKFGYFSARGSHSLSSARTYSALGKPVAKSLLGEELQQKGVDTHLRIMNQIGANFLLWMANPIGAFAKALENDSLQGLIQQMLIELNQVFEIKQQPNLAFNSDTPNDGAPVS